jgi:cell division protein FtsI (penicillin-binding protein 3)
MDVKRDIRFRVYLSFTGILVLAAAVVVKAVLIQTNEGEALRAQAERAHTRKEVLLPERGNIYGEDGALLSSTIPQFDLRVDFKAIQPDTFSYYVDTIASALAGIFNDVDAREYKRQLKAAFRQGERYWLLKKNAPFYQYQAVRDLPVFNKGKNKGGLIAESRSKRVNPYGMLAYRTIGLWRENAGNIGLEQRYDSVLSGRAGARIMRKTSRATWVPISGSEVDPQNGQDIVTTIDIGIQEATEQALLDVLQKNNSQYGTAIVMEVKTGKIKALANLGRQKDGSYWEDYNYALIPTEPGSTFKLMSLYALLEDGFINVNNTVHAGSGVAVFGRQRVVDDHANLGSVSLKHAFAQSSNVVFAHLVNKHYGASPMKYIKHLHRLKLNEPTGIDLAGEQKPLIKTPSDKYWNKQTSLPWISYGYESKITPLHTCMVYNAVANNGKLMKPYLVQGIYEYGLPVKEFEPTVLNEQIGKPATIKQLQQALLAVVEEGTAKGIRSPYYTLAGKTGTAQVADKGIKYADGVRQGSFVGYFPYDKPEYTIAVLVRSAPNGPYYGAVVGAPVFKSIADKLYTNHIGGRKLPAAEKPTGTLVAKNAPAERYREAISALGWGIDNADGQGPARIAQSGSRYFVEKKQTRKNSIPDVSGMGLKDALFLLEYSGLRVSFSGSGRVISQSIAPGADIEKGKRIHLQLG